MFAIALGLMLAPPPERLPITNLTPGLPDATLCIYKYPVSTASKECQAFCDQALGFHYSYVWIEAARSFETALQHDPDCAFAWLGLSKALEKWGKTAIPKSDGFLALTGGLMQPKLPARYSKAPKDFALERAKSLIGKCNHRERLLITAKCQEKGLWPDTPEADRKKKATATLDELLALYDDDEEAWFARGQIAEGANSQIVFYKALLSKNALHPGANHELVHMFENVKRPALGWPFAENYMKSSPGLPHAFHMQAHLAMRIGKWQHTTDWSLKAVAMEKAYHAKLGVKPAEDHQYQHHLETLTRSLVHEGRFAEAKEIQTEALKNKYNFRPEWLRMAMTLEDWKAVEDLLNEWRKTDKSSAAYYSALVALEKGDIAKAKAENDVLRQGKNAKRAEQRQWEIQGRLQCAGGEGDAGLKLLQRAVDKTKDDYQHHAWGGGAAYMEAWGEAALMCGNAAVAEEAFQEALAHDAGSVRGALGLWALADRTGRGDEAERFLKLAKRIWSKAESKDFDRLKLAYARKAEGISTGQ